MIFKFDNKFNMEMEGDTNMGKKGKGNSNPVIDINAIKDEIFNSNKTTQEETAVGFEGSSAEDNWEEPQKADDQMSKEEFNSDYNELQKKNEEEERLKQRLRMQNIPSLSNKTRIEEELWSIPNCQPIFRNGFIYKWITTLNCYQLNEMYSGKTPSIIYQSSIQRGVRTTAKGEEKPLIYTSNVKTILSKMLDGSMDAGQVLLNYAKEYPEPLNFNEDNNTLSGQGALAICDAAHRLEAMKIWVKRFKKDPLSIKDPREFYIPVVIFNLNHEEAENLFVEANSKGKAVSKTRLAFHDVFNENRRIVNIIESKSLLKGKIELVSGTISKSSNKIITYKTLLDNVAQFKASTPKEAEEIGLYLVKFWDTLINLFPKSMGNVDPEIKTEQNKQNFVLQNMFISGYFAVANELREVNNWENKLKKLAENDFLSRSNPIWSFCLREGDKIVNSSKVQKQIAEKMCDYVMK